MIEKRRKGNVVELFQICEQCMNSTHEKKEWGVGLGGGEGKGREGNKRNG